MLRSKAKSLAERKEPPTPKKPPIKEPKEAKSLSAIRHQREHQDESRFKTISGLNMAKYLGQELSALQRLSWNRAERAGA